MSEPDLHARMWDRTQQRIYDLAAGNRAYLLWGWAAHPTHRQIIHSLQDQAKRAGGTEHWPVPAYAATLELLVAAHAHLFALYQLRDEAPIATSEDFPPGWSR